MISRQQLHFFHNAVEVEEKNKHSIYNSNYSFELGPE